MVSSLASKGFFDFINGFIEDLVLIVESDSSYGYAYLLGLFAKSFGWCFSIFCFQK